MKQAHFAIALAVALVLLGLAIALSTVKSSPALTLHNLKTSTFGDAVNVSFEVSNHTRYPYGIVPLKLEIRDGPNWAVCPNGICSFSQLDGVRAHSSARSNCVIKRLPQDHHLRLIIESRRARQGLDSFLLRAKLRLLGGNRVSLHPLDRTFIVCSEGVLTTEEFTGP